MASQITPDGHVVPPLNISAPAPIVNLRGFKWRDQDKKIHGHAESIENRDEPLLTHQESQDADAALSIHLPPGGAGLPPGVAQLLSAPQLPLSATALPGQLPGQLGHIPGRPPPPPPIFPLAQFQGAYAGNGFNMIFRPRPNPDDTPFPVPPTGSPDTDNILELNLTTEQLTFGGTIGDIPNRGLSFNNQPTIFLGGLPYLQTIQDVTNPDTGKGDNPNVQGIHFEPGMWLNVPATIVSPKNPASIVRMASIPHGTTINAQGLVPQRQNTSLGGTATKPNFKDDPENIVDATPFVFGDFNTKVSFQSMNASLDNTARIPQDLKNFVEAGTINTDIIKNPNFVLLNAIEGQNIVETITFVVTTGPSPGPVAATLNGGGTANISFLAGTQDPITSAAPGATGTPNANADFMTAKFWIETVEYQVNVPKLTTRDIILLKPTMANANAPTPVFAITPPSRLPSGPQTITVPGIQIQYSQIVNLTFGPPGRLLTWPHVSVATLVPTDPQPFSMT